MPGIFCQEETGLSGNIFLTIFSAGYKPYEKHRFLSYLRNNGVEKKKGERRWPK
jgi:hypothetical protein